MANLPTHEASAAATAAAAPLAAFGRALIIALLAFLTVVDLFATQAILPSLTRAYGVSPAAMGFAVNASTMGMAASSLLVALFSRHINRRLGIMASLVFLAVPTTLLAIAPDLITFTLLRVAQGVFMASAFTLTLAWLGERYSGADAASAFAAYITGNVASNLIGRLLSAALADHLGLSLNFVIFGVLNLAGGVLVWFAIKPVPSAATAPQQKMSSGAMSSGALAAHWRNGPLVATFGIGFCILFAFIGTFTYVNFVLVQPPLNVSPMMLGVVYFVFLPAIFTTPVAGTAAGHFGTRGTLWAALAVAGLGLPLLVQSQLPVVMTGLTLVGAGTFFAQAAATGFVGRAARQDRAAASGIYLASYFSGGLVGSAVLGQAFMYGGWPACVTGIGMALAVAAMLTTRLRLPVEA